ncbi:MAG: anti-sigma factor [Saprospiraceae bacterium]|nr:anti-sigma factor [Saprospiraceae bacterium]
MDIVIDMGKRELIESGLLEAYVLGLSNEEETELVEQMSQEHPDIAKLIREMKSGMLNYCQGARKSAGKVRRIVAHRGFKKTSGQSIWTFLGPAATVLAILAIAALVNQSSQFYGLEHDLELAMHEKQEIKQRLIAMLEEQQHTDAQIDFLRDMHTHHILLSDTKQVGHARAIAYWNAQHQRAFLNVLDLPKPPGDMKYRLWAEVHGRMRDMGILHDHRGQWISLPFMHKAESIHLTMEPSTHLDTKGPDEVVAVGIVQ